MTFVGSLIRIVGNILNGLNVLTTYIFFGNPSLPSYAFGGFINIFGLESLIMNLALIYFVLDIVSLPANIFYLWSVTAPQENTETLLGNMYVQIAAFGLAIVQIVQVVFFQLGIFIVNYLNVVVSTDQASYEYYWSQFFLRTAMMTYYLLPSYLQLIPSISFAQLILEISGSTFSLL